MSVYPFIWVTCCLWQTNTFHSALALGSSSSTQTVQHIAVKVRGHLSRLSLSASALLVCTPFLPLAMLSRWLRLPLCCFPFIYSDTTLSHTFLILKHSQHTLKYFMTFASQNRENCSEFTHIIWIFCELSFCVFSHIYVYIFLVFLFLPIFFSTSYYIRFVNVCRVTGMHLLFYLVFVCYTCIFVHMLVYANGFLSICR